MRQTIEANRHPAIGMWLVGNEINLPINRFVCELEGYCKFWDEIVMAYTVMNELCGVVEQAGYLCTSPLADHAMTNRYKTADARTTLKFNSHVRLLEEITPHFHVWMVRAALSHARKQPHTHAA